MKILGPGQRPCMSNEGSAALAQKHISANSSPNANFKPNPKAQ